MTTRERILTVLLGITGIVAAGAIALAANAISGRDIGLSAEPVSLAANAPKPKPARGMEDRGDDHGGERADSDDVFDDDSGSGSDDSGPSESSGSGPGSDDGPSSSGEDGSGRGRGRGRGGDEGGDEVDKSGSGGSGSGSSGSGSGSGGSSSGSDSSGSGSGDSGGGSDDPPRSRLARAYSTHLGETSMGTGDPVESLGPLASTRKE
jgi:hypothetical protein